MNSLVTNGAGVPESTPPALVREATRMAQELIEKDKKSESKKPAKEKKAAPAKRAAEKKPTKNARATDPKKSTKVKEKKDAGPTGVRYTFKPEAKIIWTAEGNPCREGTKRHARVERVRKHAGKTVGSLLESGCKPRTLHVCVERKWVRVSA